jgi:xanthine dehydrogenase molybdenum-binding subunit
VGAGGAVKKTAEKVRVQVLALASKMLDVAVEDLDCANNEVFTISEPVKRVGIGEWPCRPCTRKTSRSSARRHSARPSRKWKSSTQTGQMRVLHLATAVDPGVAINPMQAEGRVEGAVAQGLGYALSLTGPGAAELIFRSAYPALRRAVRWVF